MKNMKVCALLCAVALSANTALPVMAAENAENTQATEAMTEVEETQPVEELKDAVTENEVESDSEEQQEEVAGSVAEPGQQESEPEDVQDETKQEEAQVVPSENNAKADAQGQDEVKEDGWYTDEDGNSYYYENGEMITSVIVEIEDEDGTYGYYFDDDGIVYKSRQTQVSYWDDEKKMWISGYIKADDKGHLYKGWDENTYYGEDYFRYADKILEQAGASYYFNEYGYLVVNQAVVIDGVLYQADEKGVLTVKDTASKTGWEQAGEKWYYYKDGKALSNTFEVINGVQYHFGFNGTMDTGKFFVENSVYWAEPDGQVVKAKGWYHSTQTKKWYWFDEQGGLVCNALVNIYGKNYYFAWDGEMQTGVFEADYNDENDNWVNKKMYADASGAIAAKPQWGLVDGNWYYTRADGTIITDEFKEINGALYKFDTDGVMTKGIFYDNEDKYFAQSSGVIVRNGWAQDGFDWYYAGKDGKLLTSQWMGNFYFDGSGIMAVGVVKMEDGTYVFDDNGHKVAEVGTTAGWQLADGTWYYYDAPGKPHNGWLDSKYYIDNGRMQTEDSVPAMGDTSREAYVGADGVIVQNGWVYERYGGSWFYSENGMLVEDGWKTINGKKYYFSSIFMNRLSFREIDGKLYEFDGSGACRGEIAKKNSWYQSPDGSWYWFNEDGTLNTEGTKKIGNRTYYFWSPSGEMMSNCVQWSNKTHKYYWIHKDGYLDTSDGWKLNEEGEWYYQENGNLVTGKKVINGVEYYFDPMMRSEKIVRENDSYIYYDTNGVKTILKNGWYHLKEYGIYHWYYFVNGTPASGWMNGYYFEGAGRMCDDYAGDNFGNTYMFDDNGHLIKNRWVFRWGDWYYASASGRLYTGERTIGGVKYLFGEDGVWVR